MAALPTLFPTSQISAGGWTDEAGGVTDLHLVIDETGTGGTDYIRGVAGDPTAAGEWGLTDMPADFGSMDSLTLEIRHSRGTVEGGSPGAGDDVTTLNLSIVDSVGAILGNIGNVEGASAGYAVKTETVAVSLTAAGLAADKATWDDARFTMDTTDVQSMGNDGHRIWVDFVRFINGTYTPAAPPGGIAAHSPNRLTYLRY